MIESHINDGRIARSTGDRQKRASFHLRLIFPAVLLLALSGLSAAEECTTAVISGRVTRDGRPLLWKNRDDDDVQNVMVSLTGGKFVAVAITTAGNSSAVYMGINAAGFAIENSVADDLEGSSGADNGVVLRQALLQCRTVEDFERLLQDTNATGRRTKTNYGVIDAGGGAAIFETGNHAFARFDANDPSQAPLGFIVRTNFGFTGNGSGSGQARYSRALALLTEAAGAGNLGHEFLLRHASRDLVNDAVNPYPLPFEGSQNGHDRGFIRTNTSINRSITRSAVVFHGVRSNEDPALATMWTLLGEPVCGVAVPVWARAEDIPAELTGVTSAPLCKAAILKKALCYPDPSSPEYLNTRALDDGIGNGLFSYTLSIEDWALAKVRAYLEDWKLRSPSIQDLRAAQNEIALQSHSCLLGCAIPNDGLAPPQALTCQTAENRSLIFREFIHVLRWAPPASGPVPMGYRVYDVTEGTRKFLGIAGPGVRIFHVRKASPSQKAIYAVFAIDISGKEGNPAWIESAIR